MFRFRDLTVRRVIPPLNGGDDDITRAKSVTLILSEVIVTMLPVLEKIDWTLVFPSYGAILIPE
jgi:hypothetical protein